MSNLSWVNIDPTHFDESIVLLVIALNSQYRVTRSAGSQVHLLHLRVEEVRQILLVDVWGDTADVQSTGLPGQVRVDTSTHAKRRYRHGGRKTWDSEDRGYLRTVRAWQIE